MANKIPRVGDVVEIKPGYGEEMVVFLKPKLGGITYNFKHKFIYHVNLAGINVIREATNEEKIEVSEYLIEDETALLIAAYWEGY